MKEILMVDIKTKNYDEFIQKNDIENELKDIEQLGKQFVQKISLLKHEIKYIFSKIKACETSQIAQNYFNILQKIQETLTILIYKENLGLPETLIIFTSDFDRIDDPELRERMFIRIKNEQYQFGKQSN